MSTAEQNPSSQSAVRRDENGEIIIDEQARAASRKKLIWIFALFFLPLFLATVWFQVVRTGTISLGNRSNGELIAPAVPFTEFTLQEQGSDVAFSLDDVRGKWTILYIPGAACDDACQKTLHDIRQSRLALNHRMERVQRVMLVSEATNFNAEVQQAQIGLRIVGGDVAGFAGQVNAAQANMEPKTNLIYLIDPNGNLMMRYTPDQLPRPLFKDLKHLLKVSRIG